MSEFKMHGINVIVDATTSEIEPTVRECLANEGFGILTEIDVAATFRAKLGIERAPLKILGACNPTFAHTALTHDPSLALALPCNVVIEAIKNGTSITAADPRELLSGAGLDELANEAAERLDRALGAVAAHVREAPPSADA